MNKILALVKNAGKEKKPKASGQEKKEELLLKIAKGTPTTALRRCSVANTIQVLSRSVHHARRSYDFRRRPAKHVGQCPLKTRMLANSSSKDHKIINGIFGVCGVCVRGRSEAASISSAVGKLNTMPWLEAKKEITEEKAPPWLTGSGNTSNTKVCSLFRIPWIYRTDNHEGGPELLKELEADTVLEANKSAKSGLDFLSIFPLPVVLNTTPVSSTKPSSKPAHLQGSTTPTHFPLPTSSNEPSSTPVPAAAAAKSSKEKCKTTGADDEEKENDEPQVNVGFISAGGRYDGLMGAFRAGCCGCQF
ncbi:hypothetical protein D9613_004550 [Agrocybe pediades]|uniref:Uncharacterized protein n=1 Tax=Agrocybe pediades TaxID=84607 RepID=A0A8H4QIZ1_9AGAR|nr:hypothetical protein D9613_004550 [Agrocybe pediades]